MAESPKWKPRALTEQSLGAVEPPVHLVATFIRYHDNQHHSGGW